jgi:hypothetical protein
LVLVVVITSYFRIALGRHLWKLFHFTIYIAAGTMFWHSLFTDPDLKNAPVDWFDGGKVFIEICLLIMLIIGFLRGQYYFRKRTRQARPVSAPAALSQ